MIEKIRSVIEWTVSVQKDAQENEQNVVVLMVTVVYRMATPHLNLLQGGVQVPDEIRDVLPDVI